jgi:hypothetical protein
MSTTAKIIHDLVEHVHANEDAIGVLSTGERIAVALVLDRRDLIGGHLSILEAVDRLGIDWTRAALEVQRQVPTAWRRRP